MTAPHPAAPGPARTGLEDPVRRPRRARHGGTGIPGHHHPGLRPVPVRRRLRHPGGGHAGRPPPAVRRGRLPGPAGVAAGRPGRQPRRVHPRPARHREIHPGQAPDHRRGRDRHQGHHPRRHQARLHAAHRASRRAGHPHRPRPGPDQPAGQRATGPGAAADERRRRPGAALGSPQQAAVPADGAVQLWSGKPGSPTPKKSSSAAPWTCSTRGTRRSSPP